MSTGSDALLTSLMTVRNGASKPAQRDWTVMVFVSLYLVLLAFFLALNALSTKEEDKIRSALESIDAKFRGPFFEESGVIDVRQRTGEVRVKNDALDDIGVLLHGLAINPDGTDEADGDALRVSVLTHTLFPPQGETLRENQAGLFDSLADILGRPDADMIDTSFMVGVGDAIPKSGRPETDLAAGRASALASALVSRGITATSVAAGLATGDPTTTIVMFKLRRPAARGRITR
jgi:hypothetical protein